jgi:hypothetical protein
MKIMIAEFLFSNGDHAEAAIAKVAGLDFKVKAENNSIVFVPSRQGDKQPGDDTLLCISFEITSEVAAEAPGRCDRVQAIVESCGGIIEPEGWEDITDGLYPAERALAASHPEIKFYSAVERNLASTISGSEVMRDDVKATILKAQFELIDSEQHPLFKAMQK